ncbi:hypothetical protein [Corynebacterium casei]|uniref:hypothetical protein n=1 Tax=Corynebacterium casei TaxID=160386 RepID=UPI003FD11821
MNEFPTVRDRKIRLKEWGLNYTFNAEIKPAYLEGCDDSLKAGIVELSTDNNGFIKTNNGLNPQGRKAILVIGASFVESMFLEPNDRFCSAMEAELEHILPSEFVVWNAGYSAMTPIHMLNKFTASLRPLFSQLAGVILAVPTVDQGIIGRKYSYWDPDQIVSPVLPLAEGVTFPDEAFDGWKDQAILFELLIRLLKSYEVPTLVLGSPFRRSTWEVDPFWQKLHTDPDQTTRAIAYLDRIVDNALQVAKDMEVPLIDSRRFSSMVGPNHRYFYDYLHLNKDGGPIYGRELAQQVAAMKIFG